MKNEEINKMGIEEILQIIGPLNYERIFNETKLHFLKEKYFKNYDDKDKAEIIQVEENLKTLNNKLLPLFNRLRILQIPYIIQYEGEFTNGNGQTYWETKTEYLYFKTQCKVDTWTTPLDFNNPLIKELLNEVCDFLLKNRFVNFRIINIKKQ